MTTYAFVDTETTGLTINDEVWEFAAVIRRTDGESTVHIHIEHDALLVDRLPEKFRADHDRRFGAASDMHVYTRAGAASIIHAALQGAHIVGANPAFDAGHLERLLHEHSLTPSWHYHLIDLQAMTLGYLVVQGRMPLIPWRSDDLAAEVMPMVDADGDPLYGRHTALGDARWCRDWWDALISERGTR